MDFVVQLCALGLIVLSVGNIHRILSSSSRATLLLPSRQEAVPQPVSRKPFANRKVIEVKAVEVDRPGFRALPAPDDWTFDDIHRSKRR
ncbi:MAG: hypothetical protein AAGB06_00050 [Verrucomicrobiota bacterium]